MMLISVVQPLKETSCKIQNGQRHSYLKTNRLSETVVRREADNDRAAERESTTLRLSKRYNVPMGSGGCS